MKRSTLISIITAVTLTIFCGGLAVVLLLTPNNSSPVVEPKSNASEFKVGDIVYVSGLNLTGVVNEIRGQSRRAEVLWNTGVMNQYSIDTTILKKVE